MFTERLVEEWCRKEKISCERTSKGNWIVEYKDISMDLVITNGGKILSMVVPLIKVPLYMEIPNKVLTNLLALHLDTLKVAKFAFRHNFFLLIADLAVAEHELFMKYIKLITKAAQDYLPFVRKLIYEDGFDPLRKKEEKLKLEVAKKTKEFPPEVISKELKKNLESLEKDLKVVVTGQDRVIKEITNELKGAVLGAKAERRRPRGTYLFMGPRGVGKTEMTFKIAALLFRGDVERYIKLDTSRKPHRITAERIVRSPFCLILIDEIEKANREVRDFYVSAIQEGGFYDEKGRRIDLCNAIIILTSNISWKEKAIGFARVEEGHKPDRAELIKVLKENGFSDILIDSIDKIILFKALTAEDMGRIMKRDLERYADTLKEQGKKFVYPEELIKLLSEKVDLNFGINSALRVLNRYVYNRIIPYKDLRALKTIEVVIKEKNKEEVVTEHDRTKKRLRIILHIR